MMSYHNTADRFLSAKSYVMLEDMLAEEFGIRECPEFSYGPFGKPYLAGFPDIHFNFSHCRKGIACAVSDTPVGVDIEEIQYDDTVALMVMNSAEYEQIGKASDPAVKFTELWTSKESFLKLTGQGIDDDIRHVLASTEGVRFDTVVNTDASYVCTSASKCQAVHFRT